MQFAVGAVETKHLLVILGILGFCLILWLISPERKKRRAAEEQDRQLDDIEFLEELVDSMIIQGKPEPGLPNFFSLESKGSSLTLRQFIKASRGYRMQLVLDVQINTWKDTAGASYGWFSDADTCDVRLDQLAPELRFKLDGKPIYRHSPDMMFVPA